MSYTLYRLGVLEKGRTVEIFLRGSAANVYLIDQENLDRYIKRLDFVALGGFQKTSPVKLQPPHKSYWNVVIDFPTGYYGEVRTSHRILKNQLPFLNQKLISFTAAGIQKESAPVAAPKPKPSPAPGTAAANVTPNNDEIICATCGAKTPKSNFCLECGNPLAKDCSVCGVVIPHKGKYCHNCGHELALSQAF